MSGTDHDAQPDWGGPQPLMILVAPQMGENIGAAARAMWNFGLEHMRLVVPRDGWPNPAATATASGASRVLDRLGVFDDTQAALQDLDFVFATTARNRDLTKPVFTPEDAMSRARGMIADGKKVGVLFGPERAGLENKDIAQANAIVSVPVNPGFASLNLAQCVLLTSYEWRKQFDNVVPDSMEAMQSDAAGQGEINALYGHFEEKLERAGFFFPAHKSDSMKLNLRNMFSRLPLTSSDVATFHGMLRQFARWKERDD